MCVNSKHSSLIDEIARESNKRVSKIEALSGGDINDVYKISYASNQPEVIKINREDKFPGMFEAEKFGLEELRSTNQFEVPKVIDTGNRDEFSYILLSHVSSDSRAPHFWNNFGKKLARLHATTNDKFGLSSSNYIGSLPQKNNFHSTAAEFYISERLEPQLKLARENGYKLVSHSSFFRNTESMIPQEKPALIHGDLWSGNYMVGSEGQPCLIDPAVAYAPREMDLALMKLFGGFPPDVFSSYNEAFPLQEGFSERISLWQLYYLLVHLNLFGGSYLEKCQQVITSFN